MANVTITQVQLIAETNNSNIPVNYYYSLASASNMYIDAINILSVGYVWDPVAHVYISGIVQMYIAGIPTPIYSTNTYASIVTYMNS